MTKETGGLAFPCATNTIDGATHIEDGMTLRDFFAGQALSLGGEFFYNLGNGCKDTETVANAAYQIADAMLKERK